MVENVGRMGWRHRFRRPAGVNLGHTWVSYLNPSPLDVQFSNVFTQNIRTLSS